MFLENLWLRDPDLVLGMLAIFDFFLLLYAVTNIEVILPPESPKIESMSVVEPPAPSLPTSSLPAPSLPEESTKLDVVAVEVTPPVEYPSPFTVEATHSKIYSPKFTSLNLNLGRFAGIAFAILALGIVAFGIMHKISSTKSAVSKGPEIVAVNGIKIDSKEKLQAVQAQAVKQSKENPNATLEISTKEVDGSIKKKNVKALRD
jgi:hypothetical protein